MMVPNDAVEGNVNSDCCRFSFSNSVILDAVQATEWEVFTQNLRLNIWHNSLSRTKTGRGIVPPGAYETQPCQTMRRLRVDWDRSRATANEKTQVVFYRFFVKKTTCDEWLVQLPFVFSCKLRSKLTQTLSLVFPANQGQWKHLMTPDNSSA